MKIRYSLTWKEYRQFYRWRRRQVPRKDFVAAFGAVGFAILLFVLAVEREAYRNPYYLPIVLAIEAKVLVLALLFGLLFGYPLAFLLEGSGRTVEIGPEGIVYNRYIERLRLPWRSIAVLDEDAQAIYMVFRQHSFLLSPTDSVYACIPKRAFSSTGEAERFYEQAQSCCREAGGEPAASV